MAVAGTKSAFQAMTMKVNALEVDGVAVLGTQSAAIADFVGDGTYSTSEPDIEVAINAIIAALVAAGIVAAS